MAPNTIQYLTRMIHKTKKTKTTTRKIKYNNNNNTLLYQKKQRIKHYIISDNNNNNINYGSNNCSAPPPCGSGGTGGSGSGSRSRSGSGISNKSFTLEQGATTTTTTNVADDDDDYDEYANDDIVDVDIGPEVDVRYEWRRADQPLQLQPFFAHDPSGGGSAFDWSAPIDTPLAIRTEEEHLQAVREATPPVTPPSVYRGPRPRYYYVQVPARLRLDDDNDDGNSSTAADDQNAYGSPRNSEYDWYNDYDDLAATYTSPLNRSINSDAQQCSARVTPTSPKPPSPPRIPPPPPPPIFQLNYQLVSSNIEYHPPHYDPNAPYSSDDAPIGLYEDCYGNIYRGATNTLYEANPIQPRCNVEYYRDSLGRTYDLNGVPIDDDEIELLIPPGYIPSEPMIWPEEENFPGL